MIKTMVSGFPETNPMIHINIFHIIHITRFSHHYSIIHMVSHGFLGELGSFKPWFFYTSDDPKVTRSSVDFRNSVAKELPGVKCLGESILVL